MSRVHLKYLKKTVLKNNLVSSAIPHKQLNVSPIRQYTHVDVSPIRQYTHVVVTISPMSEEAFSVHNSKYSNGVLFCFPL